MPDTIEGQAKQKAKLLAQQPRACIITRSS